LASADNYDAVFLEPIQGEAGVICPPTTFIPEVAELCKEHDLLLMVDEVQSGNGRTGKHFAFQHSGVQPDVVTTAKGLANGFPAGATLLGGKASGLFTPGTHGSTYGGNPAACAAIEAVYSILNKPGFLDRVAALSHYFQTQLVEHLGTQLESIDGKGLMLGLQLSEVRDDLTQRMLDQGILVNVINASRIRLLPPLIMSHHEAKELAVAIAQALD
jgi:acetylornithine aminotransferase